MSIKVVCNYVVVFGCMFKCFNCKVKMGVVC